MAITKRGNHISETKMNDNNNTKETKGDVKNGSQSLEAQKASLMATPNQRFSMVRNFYVADFLTLMNGACGMGSLLSCLNYLGAKDKFYLWVAFFLIPLGVFFDVLDGRVARWRNESSVLGQELDSLADLVIYLYILFSF